MAEVRSCMERPFDEVLKSLKGESHIFSFFDKSLGINFSW